MAWCIADDEMLVSPLHQPLGFLTTSDVARVSLNGKYQNEVVPGLSAEFLAEIFRQDSDVEVVIHAHPKFSSMLSLSQLSLPLSLLPDLQQRIGQIKTIEFQVHWTEQVLRRLQARNHSRSVFLIENYGVLVFAEDLITAALTLDSLEHYLEIIFYSQNNDRNERMASSYEVQPVEQHLSKIYLEVTTRCKFIADGAAFISVEGEVSPCLLASRTHTAYILGAEKQIRRLSLGNVFQNDIAIIWDSDAYRSLRDKFRYYDFPDCFTCRGFEMCLNRLSGEHDSFLSETPCSDCLWAKDVVLCP